MRARATNAPRRARRQARPDYRNGDVIQGRRTACVILRAGPPGRGCVSAKARPAARRQQTKVIGVGRSRARDRRGRTRALHDALNAWVAAYLNSDDSNPAFVLVIMAGGVVPS